MSGGGMKEELNIAIFGLSLNVLENMKQKVQQLYDSSLKINWANIADPHLDILLVNDMFFGSPTIQNLISYQKVPYLRLVNKNDKSGVIEGDVLYLPFNANDQVKKWFKECYVGNFTKTQKIKVQAPKAVSQDINKVIQEFLNTRNGNLQIFDTNGNLALMNIRTEQVWPDAQRRINGTDTTLNYTYATMQMTQTVSAIQGVDLRHWLWSLLWNSPNIPLQKKSSSTFYKLQYWPQPNTIQERREIFKIAACFEKGASIQLVEKKTNLSKDLIQKFVAIGVLIHAIDEISENEAQLVVSQNIPSENGLRGFFGKLRKKLGL